MLNAQVIGVGAAGNKGAIKLLESEVIRNPDDVMLINSTPKDIDQKYINMYKQIGDKKELGGCGKEPEVGKQLCLEALQSGSLNLENFIKPTTKLVIVISSTEGGTGSGAAPVIAKYIKQVIGVNVHIFAFLGFEDDARGLLNTINFFKEIPEDVTVEAIRNKNFLNGKGNYLKAEEEADKEMCTRISVLLGNLIIPSSQNMDDTDLYKVATYPGFMNIEHIDIDEPVKNVQHFNEILKNLIDNTKSLRPDGASQKLLGVIINLPEREKDSIDYSCSEICNRYGKAFEKYMHVQSQDGVHSFIAFISAGMDLPYDEVKSIYDRYVNATQSVKKDKDAFFSQLGDMNRDDSDNMFDLSSRKNNKTASNAFFESFNLETPNRPTTNNKEEKKSSGKKGSMDNF